MKIASISHIKKELASLDNQELIEICLRLAKYKKDNKELLNYHLFEKWDEDHFIAMVKAETDEIFNDVNTRTFYFAKKTIRKALRFINKQIKYSPEKQTELDIRIHFCQEMLNLDFEIRKSRVLLNLYENQLKKIDKVLSGLHEDHQLDYQEELEEIRSV